MDPPYIAEREMSREEQIKNGLDILCLIRGMIRQEASFDVSELDLEALLRESHRQMLTVAVYTALEQFYRQMPPESKHIWKQAKEQAVYTALLMDVEKKELFSFLEQSNIRYLPLKGCVIKELYPAFGMRQMGDVDILLEPAYRPHIRELMEARGYKTVKYGVGHHDVYQKAPVYCFEMHYTLFDEGEYPQWSAYYREIGKRLLPVEPGRFEYRLSDEDLYIYLLLHMYQHYELWGIGLRYLLDCYFFLKEKDGTLDWLYIRGELKKLGIDSFEEKMHTLALKFFDRAENLTEEETAFLHDLCCAGAQGTMDLMAKHGAEHGRWRYIKKRLFPSYGWFKDHLPFYARHPYLIPAYDVFRIFRAIFFRRKQIKREVSALKNKVSK